MKLSFRDILYCTLYYISSIPYVVAIIMFILLGIFGITIDGEYISGIFAWIFGVVIIVYTSPIYVICFVFRLINKKALKQNGVLKAYNPIFVLGFDIFIVASFIAIFVKIFGVVRRLL